MRNNTMSEAKNFMIKHNKRGKCRLGDLTKNEACRVMMELILGNQQIGRQMQLLDVQYANHLASFDACDHEYGCKR